MVHIGSKEANKKDYEYLNEGEDMSSPYISPPLGKKEGLPKTLMILAEYDGLRLEGEFYAGQLKKADVPIRVIRYRGVCHAFFEQLGILPQAESAVDMISRYLNDF
jgi:acetyl esterase/lipase